MYYMSAASVKATPLALTDSGLNPTATTLRKKFLLTFGFAAIMTIIAAGQIFAAALSPKEEESLRYIREEEKVARDVYIAMYDRWGLAIFKNISVSEQTHMDAVKTLLDRYKLEDPAQTPGKFSDPHLQEMYDYLIGMGNSSVIQALNVGVIIEETDIKDLEADLAIVVHKDIKRVYQNLMAGSENHMAAFRTVLTNY
jgi:hypothetical protein